MNQHWSTEVAIGEFCETGSGGTPDRSKGEYYDGVIPWVKSGELREGLILDTEEHLSELGLKNSAAKLVPSGALLVAMYGATVGRLAVLGCDAATNQAVCNIRPDPQLADTRYLFRALQAKVPHLVSIATGGAQPNISQEKIRKTKVRLPPVDVQRRIAAILDKADALRQKRKRAIALLDSLMQSIFLEMFGDPESNPLGWPEVSFGDLILDGPTNGLYRPAGEYGSGTPIVRIDAFYDGVITDPSSLKRLRIDSKTQSTFALQQGEIVINRVNSLEYLGKSALVPALSEPTVFESNMMRVRVDNARITSGFCVALLQMDWIKKQIARAAKKAVNQASINQTDVKSFSMFLPPLTRQLEFDAVIAQIDLMKDCISINQLDHLFSSLQHRAFSGQL